MMIEDRRKNVATCPFCGGHNVMIGRDIKTNEWYMNCFDCKMSTKSNKEDKVNGNN